MNVLVLLGHPRTDSYCAALAAAYVRGAQASGAQVELLEIANLDFEVHVKVPSPQKQEAEPDIIRARTLITWADHLAFVFPIWWGSMPALLKGFLDRVLVPGFAFRELQFDSYAKLLSPRSAQLICSMDTPPLIDRIINRSSAINALSVATLRFCGISPVRVMRISPIKHASEEQLKQRLDQAYAIGKQLESGVKTPFEKAWSKLSPWLKALRLQFYPMTFFAYASGAFAAANSIGAFHTYTFILAYLLLFVLEAMVVFSNDYCDFETDRRNRTYSMFTGGSRVLHDGSISKPQLKKGIQYSGLIFIALALLLLAIAPLPQWQTALLIVFLFCCTMAYTAAPLKLSYHGLGELTVGFTHSFMSILFGYYLQNGSFQNPYPWLLGIPLFFSILPAILMAGVPDAEADKSVAKNTLTVLLGKTKVTFLAVGSILLCLLSTLLLKENGLLADAYGNLIYLSFLHAAWLIYLLLQFAHKKQKPARIDSLLAVALAFILWYALIPYFNLR